MDLIDRQAAIEELMNMIEQHKNETPFHGALFHWTGIKAMLLKQPTIEAEPVRRGKWTSRTNESKHTDWYSCSGCGGQFDYKWKFCPNCGAKMEVDDG